ncbi:MAG: hypothetical protein K1X94_03255 [Sandaracinaceae bacterium]|nr:hypothetical protein [Sandaracinaceae bacterium]
MTSEEVLAQLRARVRPVLVDNPAEPGAKVGVRCLSGRALDDLELALVKDAKAAIARGRNVTREALAVERRLRVVAAQLLDASTVDEPRASPRYSLEELRAMAPEERAQLEALVEAHGHIPGPSADLVGPIGGA